MLQSRCDTLLIYVGSMWYMCVLYVVCVVCVVYVLSALHTFCLFHSSCVLNVLFKCTMSASGTVQSIKEFGVFVRLDLQGGGARDGLVHKSQLSSLEFDQVFPITLTQ